MQRLLQSKNALTPQNNPDRAVANRLTRGNMSLPAVSFPGVGSFQLKDVSHQKPADAIPVIQRFIEVPKSQVYYVNAEVAFHALRSTYPDTDKSKLYKVLSDLCAKDMKYYNIQSLKTDIDHALTANEDGPNAEMDKVMEIDNIKAFIKAQDKFQILFKNMNGLQSAGFEYEFASFTQTKNTAYTKEEIIPSHQLMGKSLELGDYFKLAWRLESDAHNTLELVTPPMVFPKTNEGNIKREWAKSTIETAVNNIKDSFDPGSKNLPDAVNNIEQTGLGIGWNVNGTYKDFGVTKNIKSGGIVYSQSNVSLYANEIGEMLENSFSSFDKNAKEVFEGTLPENTARKVRYAFALSEAPKPVANAVAVFSRYASNALAIPSMRSRQETGVRKNTMPTEVKETLGIWVKTDALNLLKHILTVQENAEIFCKSLYSAKGNILNTFLLAGNQMIKEEENNCSLLLETFKSENNLTVLFKSLPLIEGEKPMARIERIKKLVEAKAKSKEDELSKLIESMKKYAKEMMMEVEAFIIRSLEVQKHVNSVPKSTTKDFLLEKYGTGEGVRKGTYLKDIPTDKGSMYVTEIR
jgi:hypothetical protein